MSAKKVLIIEDDHALSKTLKNVLSLSGYDAEIANSGAEGIQKAYEYGPDLILCDINMSPIDGYQVYNILNDSSVTNKIPFIYISGKSDLEEIRLGMELGVDDYIVKPFSNEELLKSIKVRMAKYEKLMNAGKSDYRALVELSPNGIFLFDGDTIYEINEAFSKMIGISADDIKRLTIRDFINKDSYAAIQSKIFKCTNGLIKNFDEVIEITTPNRTADKFKLYVTTSQKYKGFTFLIGLLAPVDGMKTLDQPEYERLVSILSEEKVAVSGELAVKLQRAFDFPAARSGNVKTQGAEKLFSKREQEVLTLSCKGLPIKIIADELSISDRTVEKHRASLMEKTGSKNIVEVIIYALKNDLVNI
ncbi:response regulator [Mangrovibacterium sp.]|uniref:response regulator n=1 Tax=Mangrovibacterium sp. TaxID=1961364 RepID=UPI003567CDC7